MFEKNGYSCGWADTSVWDAAQRLTDWFCSGNLLVSCVDSIRPPVPGCLRTTPKLIEIVPDLPLIQFCYWIPRERVRTVIQADLLFSGFCEAILVSPETGDPTSAPPVSFTTDEIKFDNDAPNELLEYLDSIGAQGALGDGIGSGMNFAVKDKRIADLLCLPPEEE